jgi:hypothetical protein
MRVVWAMDARGLLALADALLIAWTGGLVVASFRRIRPLAQELPASGSADGVTVVVTARNEEAAIASTIRRVLAQRGREIRVVAVDDRSTDGTGRILDELARELDPGGLRLRVLHIVDLPPGWLGKVHACARGAAEADTPWILFLDGDVRLEDEDLLARTVALAGSRGLDHVAVFPDTRPMSLLLEASMTVFAQLFVLGCRLYEMDRDRPRGGGGVGAFNLVRHEAYLRIGGHELLRLEIGDDFRLGSLLKESGARQRLFLGTGLVLCRWQSSVRALVRGLEKNLFAGTGFSVPAVAGLSLHLVATGPLPWALAAWSLAESRPILSLPLLVLLTLSGLGWAILGRRQGARFGAVLLAPAGALVVLVAAWNSTIRTLARGGVRWRDTFYPLATLRAGRVRPGAGLRFHPLLGQGSRSATSTPKG